MKYLIYAEICLTIGAPTWVVTICWVCFGLSILKTIGEVIKENEKEKDTEAKPTIHGHWIRDFSITEDTFYKCSVCGRQECLMEKYDPYEEMPYCHCGAKMDKE